MNECECKQMHVNVLCKARQGKEREQLIRCPMGRALDAVARQLVCVAAEKW